MHQSCVDKFNHQLLVAKLKNMPTISPLHPMQNDRAIVQTIAPRGKTKALQSFCYAPTERVLSRVMRKYNSVTYEVGKAKAEQASGMFGLAAGQRAASCPSRVAKPLAKPLTGGWRSATYARSQQSAPCFSRSICSSDFILI